ncbi:GNAT family N-acetyltransferase [Pseudonocardia sp. ICBG1293]|uniref:GNAT family N-acetyltransferase n=1 Tax=Pseudonocardia sp. ICBG1293 TaxID=2844382 RepID=UPI001CD01978|nr:GNAT family N-acetyltransferase [Pseudonocardia sp. ICBG1293]
MSSAVPPGPRPRTDDDLPACVAVLRAVHATDRYPSTWPAAPVVFLSPPGLVTALVVPAGERVVGHAALLADDGDSGALRLTRVFVDPALRRAGHARALLDGIAVELAARGRDGVLDVVESVAAERLYRTAGWVRTGTAPAGWRFPDGREPVAALYRLPVTQRRKGDDTAR